LHGCVPLARYKACHFYTQKRPSPSLACDVQGCTNIAVAGMQKSVDVQGCTNITVAGMQKSVDVQGCTKPNG